MLDATQDVQFKSFTDEFKNISMQLDRRKEAQAMALKTAKPVGAATVAATPENDPYVKDKSLVFGGMLKMYAAGRGDAGKAALQSTEVYGESHPVTKALAASTGTAGGFVIRPDFMNELVPFLYNAAILRKAGMSVRPMPNGTMTLPKMIGTSKANWIGEAKPISESQPSFGQIVANARKLSAWVPITNDVMRYADAGFDGEIRDDIVKQMALGEDFAGMYGTGTQFMPKGLRSFCLPGNFIGSTSAFTLQTINQELAAARTRLRNANIPMAKPAWLFNPRTEESLYSTLNALGVYVFRDQMDKGILAKIPYFSSNSIPINQVSDADGTLIDCSDIFLVDMAETILLESRVMELYVSTDGTFIDAQGASQSLAQNDMVAIRAISAMDFQLRHDPAVTIIKNVRWQ